MQTSIAQTQNHVNSETCFASYILIHGEPWVWFAPFPSYVVYTPPEPDRGACYAASLAGDDFLEDFRAALRTGDDLAARCALHALRGLAEVVVAKLRGPLQ